MNQKKQLSIIFLTVFIYLLGFGIIIPIIPTLAKDFGASATQVGLLMSIYSAMQFLFSPFWGRISDKVGRRPIILFCLIGESLSYILFARANSLHMLFVARLLAGFFGASISTSSAYISDITTEENRSKGMALIGVAFGLGFLFGPAIGAGLALWGEHISSLPHYGTSFAAYCVSGICVLNFIFAFKFLPESLNPNNKNTHKRKLTVALTYLKQPVVGALISLFFISSVAMSIMEATLILFVGDKFQWTTKEISMGFAYIGFVSIISQGLIVRRYALPKLGEKKMLLMGLTFMGISMVLIPFSPLPVLAFAMTLLSVGNSFVNPSIMGSISLLVSSKEQGAALGSTQSMASLGRIVGPAIGGLMYGNLIYFSPFIAAAAILFSGSFWVSKIYKFLPESAKKQSSSPAIGVGSFQITNLIKSRVPFLLFNLGGVFPQENFKGEELNHLQSCLITVGRNTTATDVINELKKRSAQENQPIIISCDDGRASQKIAAELLQKNWMNTYYIDSGIKGLVFE